MRSYFTVQTFSSILTILYSRRRQTASSMATKRQSVDYRERERLWLWLLNVSLLNTEKKRLSLRLLSVSLLNIEREREAQAMATKR